MYLAAAGVGRIGIVDFDVVEESNLQRQIIHGTKDLGRRKIESARDRLRDINPHIEIETHESRLTSHNAMGLFRNYDIIVDGTDNFPTRYLVNDACVLSGKPNVYGSIFRFEGQASVFWAEKGACYRCLYPEPPPPGLVPSCAEGGVLGVLPGIVGAIQANETIKLILGAEDTLINRLMLFDAWSMKFREFKLRKDPKCPVCGEEAKRVLHAPPIVFKGSGFYVTDSRKGSQVTVGDSGMGAAPPTPPAEGKSDNGGSSDSKPAAASTTDK